MDSPSELRELRLASEDLGEAMFASLEGVGEGACGDLGESAFEGLGEPALETLGEPASEALGELA